MVLLRDFRKTTIYTSQGVSVKTYPPKMLEFLTFGGNRLSQRTVKPGRDFSAQAGVTQTGEQIDLSRGSSFS